MNCKLPVASTNVSTVYRYKTVPEVSNVNQFRNVTRTSYRDITRTKYHDVRRPPNARHLAVLLRFS
jgi:hypothetical protein